MTPSAKHSYWTVALALLVVAAAALRFPTLSVQSFWLDEGFTSVVVSGSVGDVLPRVRETESTPPLYYLAAWGWTQLFGASDVGLRSLSALAGTLTVPAGYWMGRAWLGSRAGIAVAALAATSPFLVWYAQEARAYALGVLFVTLSLALLHRAAYGPPRAGWAWAAMAASAVWTHYFSAFVILPAALFLLALRRRDAFAPVTVAGLACLPLVPLVSEQTGDFRSAWLGRIPFDDRAERAVRSFVSAPPGAPGRFLGLTVAIILVVGLAAALARRRPPFREPLVAITGIAVAAPLALAAAGVDYVYYRNFIFVWPAVWLLAVTGLFALGERLGWAAVGAVAACFVAINVGIASDSDYQREDWQHLASALGERPDPRVLMVLPRFADAPLRHYGHDLEPLTPTNPITTREIAIAGRFAASADLIARNVRGGFRVAFDESYSGGLRLVTLRSRRPLPLGLEQLAGAPAGTLWVERPAGE